MDHEGFSSFLTERAQPADEIAPAIAAVERFEAYLQQPGRSGELAAASPADVAAYSAVLMRQGRNSEAEYLALARYGWFIHNDPLYVAVVELLDGSEALENLHAMLGRELGEQQRDAIFADTPPPQLGTPNREKPRSTQTVIERLAQTAGTDACARIVGQGLRTLSDEAHHAARRQYEECGDLDRLLELRAAEFIAGLERAHETGRLWFTQEITDSVIEYVRATPEIASAVRRGNTLFKTKIPYQAHAYLKETDPRLKRYHYCHCPWVRESLRTGEASVPPVFCNCSAAFVKKPWEVILGRPLAAEVLETVLRGDPHCRFAIHLPEGIA